MEAINQDRARKAFPTWALDYDPKIASGPRRRRSRRSRRGKEEEEVNDKIFNFLNLDSCEFCQFRCKALLTDFI